MKTNLLTGLSILYFTFSLAQEKPLAKIHYQFCHVNHSTVRDKALYDEVVSYLAKDSYYKHPSYRVGYVECDASETSVVVIFTGGESTHADLYDPSSDTFNARGRKQVLQPHRHEPS